MKRSSWRNVLRPQASRLVSVNTPLAQVYAAAISESDQKFSENWIDGDGVKKDIGALKEIHCMSADDQMEKAVRRMHVRPEDADMTFVRHYQGRDNVRFLRLLCSTNPLRRADDLFILHMQSWGGTCRGTVVSMPRTNMRARTLPGSILPV